MKRIPVEAPAKFQKDAKKAIQTGAKLIVDGVILTPPNSKRLTWRLKYTYQNETKERSGGRTIESAYSAFLELITIQGVLKSGVMRTPVVVKPTATPKPTSTAKPKATAKPKVTATPSVSDFEDDSKPYVDTSNDATDKKIEIASTNTLQDCFNNYLETSVLDDSNSNPLTSFDLVPKASENGTEISDIDP